MKPLIQLLLLLAVTQPVCAMSLEDKMLNLFYFEYARTSAGHCETRGFPSRQIFQDWEKKNIHIQRRILGELTADLINMGLNNNQTEQKLQEIKTQYRKMALDEINNNRVPCTAYREFISGFNTLPQSVYEASK
jgi:hypothetical protein